jgi:hypothetical protein
LSPKMHDLHRSARSNGRPERRRISSGTAGLLIRWVAWSVAGFGGVPASRRRVRGQLRGQNLGLIRAGMQPQNSPVEGGDEHQDPTLAVVADGDVSDHHRPPHRAEERARAGQGWRQPGATNAPGHTPTMRPRKATPRAPPPPHRRDDGRPPPARRSNARSHRTRLGLLLWWWLEPGPPPSPGGGPEHAGSVSETDTPGGQRPQQRDTVTRVVLGVQHRMERGTPPRRDRAAGLYVATRPVGMVGLENAAVGVLAPPLQGASAAVVPDEMLLLNVPPSAEGRGGTWAMAVPERSQPYASSEEASRGETGRPSRVTCAAPCVVVSAMVGSPVVVGFAVQVTRGGKAGSVMGREADDVQIGVRSRNRRPGPGADDHPTVDVDRVVDVGDGAPVAPLGVGQDVTGLDEVGLAGLDVGGVCHGLILAFPSRGVHPNHTPSAPRDPHT